MSNLWWDNSGLKNQIIEAVCQVIFWFITLTLFGKWIYKKCEGKDFFENRVAKQPGGKDEFVIFCRVFPQHFLAAVLIWIAITFNNSNIFRSATLSEFGYEIIDLSRIWYLYFITKELSGPMGNVIFTYMTLHHLPGILSIIPANIYCGDDPYFQQIPWCLLSLPWINVILMVLCKCADLNDIHERAQFMVWYSINVMIFVYCRFIWLPQAFYHFFINSIINYDNIFLKVILIFYGVVITIFNVYITYIMIEREYKLMYGSKDTKEREKVAIKLQRQLSLRGGGISSHIIMNEIFNSNQKKIYPKYSKAKFKRHHTEPSLFDNELHSNKK